MQLDIREMRRAMVQILSARNTVPLMLAILPRTGSDVIDMVLGIKAAVSGQALSTDVIVPGFDANVSWTIVIVEPADPMCVVPASR